MITPVELGRALNALATTLGDQRPPALDAKRAQEIVDGALAGERKLLVQARSDVEGALVRADDQVTVATIARDDGTWRVRHVNET